MLNRRDVFEIHRLKDKGLSIRKIAITLNLDRGTVGRYIKHPEGSGKKQTKRPSKLDPYKEFIKEIYKKFNGSKERLIKPYLEILPVLVIIKNYYIANLPTYLINQEVS